MSGHIICIGLGPGDPELMSVKSHRILSQATRIAYFRKAGRQGQARRMVEGLFPPDAQELPMDYPVTTEIPLSDPRYNQLLGAFYDDWAQRLHSLSHSGDVVVLCEGDPFFYGSFMHLYTRLPRDKVQIVPGIPGMAGCWTVSGQPITWGDDILTVLPATLPQAELTHRLRQTDAAVIMKIGRNLPRLVAALQASGCYDRAVMVEYGTMPNQRIRPLADVTGEVPYFSIVLVHGQGRRP